MISATRVLRALMGSALSSLALTTLAFSAASLGACAPEGAVGDHDTLVAPGEGETPRLPFVTRPTQLVYVNFNGQRVEDCSGYCSDAQTNRSWAIGEMFGTSAVNFAPYTKTYNHATVLKVLKDAYAGYNVAFTTTRPAAAPYSMIVISPTEGPHHGVAPLDCNNSNPNDIAFVYSIATSSASFIGRAAAHELGHTFGLHHVASDADVMHWASRGYQFTVANYDPAHVGDMTCSEGPVQDAPTMLWHALGEPPQPSIKATGPKSGLFPLQSPQRMLDTRKPNQGGKLQAKKARELLVAGQAGIPADATAVAINATITQPEGYGHLTLYPCDGKRPVASNVNYVPGETTPNFAVVALGASGKLCIWSLANAHVVIDAFGYMGQGGARFNGLRPARLMDTRTGNGGFKGKLEAMKPVPLVVGGRGGVPKDADAVSLNVTVTQPVGYGHLTVFPCGEEPPGTSNLNYVPSETVPNHVMVRVGQDRSVCIRSLVPTHVVVDVMGYFDTDNGSLLVPVQPTRMLDTRIHMGWPKKLAAQEILTLPLAGERGLPAGITAAALNVTVTKPVAPGHLAVFPCGSTPPGTSNLNFSALQTIPNFVVSQVGDGAICMRSLVDTEVIADIAGYFLPAN